MSVNLNNLSIVRYFDSPEKHRCGYCKSESGSISNGMWVEQLTVEDYQDLIDRGWRRSGKYCYKPIMNQTCCPQYTIRCDAPSVSLTKSQKKVIKRFNKFIQNGVLNKKDLSDYSFEDNNYEQEFTKYIEPKINLNEVKFENKNESKEEMNTDYGTGEPCHTRSVDIKNSLKTDSGIGDAKQDESNNYIKTHKKGIGADSSKPPCKKAKILRIERKKEKLNKMGMTLENIQKEKPEAKSIEEFIENISGDSKYKLKIHLFSCDVFTQNRLEEEYELYKKYQMTIHNDPPEKLSLDRFKRFLVTSPLKPREFPNGKGPGYGSFHQQYWLNGKLIAVGVIDILPRCVSSVYFFYDPEFTSLSLGTYSSLREVYFTRTLQKEIPELRYYYMGFYIHSCPKMRYKGKLVPSYLLCPESYSWIPIEKANMLLNVNKYSRLNPDATAIDINTPTDQDFSKAKIVYNRQFMSFTSFKKFSSSASQLFNQIGVLVGKVGLQRMVFWIE